MIFLGNGSNIPVIRRWVREAYFGLESVWFVQFKKAEAVRESMAPFLNRFFMHSPVQRKMPLKRRTGRAAWEKCV